MQTYQEQVAQGQIWEWNPDGMELAKAERFNMNIEACIAAAFQALLEAKQYTNGAVEPKADKAASLEGYGITDAFTKEEVSNAINAAIDNLVGLAPAELDTLKEIADKIALSDSDIQGVISALAGKAALTQVYTRDVLDTKFDAKLNAADFSDADVSALQA